MNNTMQNYHHTYDELNNHIKNIFDIVKQFDPNAICKQNPYDDDGMSNVHSIYPYGHKNYIPTEFYIGVYTLQKNQKGNYIRDEDFVSTLRMTYHELCHVTLRKKVFNSNTTDKASKNMAKISLAGDFLREYYGSSYWMNPEEITCELFAFKQLNENFIKNPKYNDIDWENILLNHIKASGFLDVTIKDNLTSLNEAINAYENRLVNVYPIKKIDEIYMLRKLNNITPNTLNFQIMNKRGLIQKIIDAPDNSAETDIINNYIAKNQPEFFRGYQCIQQEYKDISIQNLFENHIAKHIYGVKALPAKSVDEALDELMQLCNNSFQQQSPQQSTQPQQTAQVQITTDDNVDPDIYYALNCIKHEVPQPVGPINLPIMGLNCKLMPQGVPEDEPTNDDMQYDK